MSRGYPDLDMIEREAVTWVRKLVSREMTRADHVALKLWREGSPQHEAAFVRTERVWSKIGAAGPAAFEPAGDILEELDAFGRQRRIMSRRIVLAGSVTAVAAAATFYGAVHPPLGLWPSLPELNADYRTATGEQRTVMLDADVAVNLNTQTSLAIRRADTGEQRLELISGEASFAAPVHASRPLVVMAADGTTTTTSGLFEVRYTAYGDRSPVCVTCLEGAVQIKHGAETAALRAGERTQYDVAGISPISTIDTQAASDWRRGIVTFRDTPVVEAVGEINRYRPGRVILLDSPLNKKMLSGRFRIDEMNQVLRQLERALNAKVRHLPGGVVLLS
jgi:transmembrane sensor